MNDLIIIGAGPGGYELALEASQKGLVTTLIEKEKIGGTCLNSGCIPTKAYYKTASLIRELKSSSTLGVEGDFKINFLNVKKRKDEIVKQLQEGIIFSLKKAKVNYINGFAKLIDHNTVIVNDELIQGKNIVIATGSRGFLLPGFEDALTSKEILELEILPKKLVIIGGGVIGIEMASIFNYLGTEVEVVEYMDSIIPNADKEVSKRLLNLLKNQGIKFHLNSKALRKEGSIVYIDTKSEIQSLECDQVLIAIGRKPNLEGIGLEDLKINFNSKGIIVDQNFKTNLDNIYAIGDVTGKMMLAHFATYNGYQVLKDIMKEDRKINFDLVPGCVFTFPEVSWVGMTEEECKASNLEYNVYKGLYRANGKALTMNETDGFVKMIVSNGEIKGVHIIGVDSSTLIHEMNLVMNVNMHQKEFLDIIHAHPTISEILHMTWK
jgi:dihydrolipoamide dehydrogenase